MKREIVNGTTHQAPKTNAVNVLLDESSRLRPQWRNELAAERSTIKEVFNSISEKQGEHHGGGKRVLEEAMLLYLVPLVRVAWAEGRITKREQSLITEVARLHGIRPGTLTDIKLQGWLTFEPTPEFYDEACESLRGLLALLPADKRDAGRHDLVSLCTRVAEASGGERQFSGGGSRICPEEITTVKSITSELRREGVSELEAKRGAEERWALREATGISDEHMLRELQAHAITAATARVLQLAPLVQIAWAEGNVTRRERTIILSAARLRGVSAGSPAYDLLNRWLDRRPTDEFFDLALRTVRAMFALLPPELREVDEWDLLSYCIHVASASKGNADFSDLDSRVCDEELRALDALSARLRTTDDSEALKPLYALSVSSAPAV